MIRKEGTGKRPWRSRLHIDGRDTLRSFPTKKLAEEYERGIADARAREAAGLAPSLGPITYDALCNLYLAQYGERSKEWLERMLKHSRDRWGAVNVRHLRSELIGKWLHSELELAPKTRLHILTAMRQVLAAGIEWGYLSKNPARSVKPPKKASEPTKILPLDSWDQVLKLAAAAGHYGPAIRFACATGLRPGEWMALQWRDIDFQAKIVNVRRTLSGDQGKTAAALRPVTLSAPALRALSELPRPLDSSSLVFVTPKGKQLNRSNFAKHVWKPALKKLGLAHRPSYQMRHTYATLALAQGATLEWIGKQMGHTDISITLKHYARFTKVVDDRMRSLLDQMEETDDTRGRGEAGL